MYASKYCNSIECVKLLLEHPSTDVNLQNKDGYSALMNAIQFCNTYSSIECVELLLQHALIDIHIQDKKGAAAAEYAAKDLKCKAVFEAHMPRLLNRKWSVQRQFLSDASVQQCVLTLLLIRNRIGKSKFPKEIVLEMCSWLPITRQRAV